MNRTEVIGEVSRMSGVEPQDCDKVLIALEQVMNSKLANSRGAKSVFEKIYRLMSVLKNK